MGAVVGRELRTSVLVQKQIDQLVGEVEKLSARIEGIRSPDGSEVESYKAALEKLGKSRGRPLHYPYLGSGIGRGPYVELEDGSVKLDLINGIGVHLFGHSHPRVLRATVRGALSDITNQGNLQPNTEYAQLANKIVELAGKNTRLRHTWITTCGSRANEKALKICRQKLTPARKVLAFEKAFAGRTTMMAQITDNPGFKEGLPDYHEVLRLPFFDKADPVRSTERTLAKMKEHISNNKGEICSFMFEIVQGEGGFRIGTREFFLPLLELAKENKIPCWADEIQTFTRTGELFAFETLGISSYIDVCTIAKVLQSAAVIYTEELNPKPGLIAGTFSGSSAALSAGFEILEMITTGGYLGAAGKVETLHKKVVGMLNGLSEGSCKGHIEDAGGLGLMIAFTPFRGDKDKVTKLLSVMFKNGIVAFSAGRDPYRVRFLVPLVLTDADIEVARQILEKSIFEVVQGA